MLNDRVEVNKIIRQMMFSASKSCESSDLFMHANSSVQCIHAACASRLDFYNVLVHLRGYMRSHTALSHLLPLNNSSKLNITLDIDIGLNKETSNGNENRTVQTLDTAL